MNIAPISISHPEKVVYPSGFSKGDVASYYQAVAHVLLPHLAGRPLTLKRYPHGVDGPFFYEKECPRNHPANIIPIALWSAHRQAPIHYCTVSDPEALIWLAHIGNLELHTTLARGNTPTAPTSLVFDLDPGLPAGLPACCQVALLVRDLLADLDLITLAKTSGSKGLQVYAPLNTAITFDQTKPFAHAVAALLTKRHPDLVVAKMTKTLRTGKVLIDWSQNDPHKTTINVYSLRAMPRPTVSTPVTWDEIASVAASGKEQDLQFEAHAVKRRIAEYGDLFKDHLTLQQTLPEMGVRER